MLPGAGIRKPPREETAGEKAPCRGRYGDLSATDRQVGCEQREVIGCTRSRG